MVKLIPKSKPKKRSQIQHITIRFLPIPLELVTGIAGNLIPLLFKSWKLILFGLLISFIIYQNYMTLELLKPVGFRTIPGIMQEITITKEQLSACEMGREKLKGEIEATNAQINKWIDLSQKLQADQIELNSALIELKKKSSAEVEIILKGPIPQTCKGAIKLLKDAIIKGDLTW